MTPSQRLDSILESGQKPCITDIIDTRRYKYVRASHQAIRFKNYVIDIPYGMLSDGSSCVPDRVPPAWWAHDRLYLSPWALYKNVRKRLSKVTCDLIYARIGLAHANPIVFFEGLSLATGFNNSVWRKYREQDESALLESHIVPRPTCWDFRTQYTRDAVWIGPKHLEK